MGLYVVKIERSIVVVADNDTEALVIAESHEREECMNDPDLIYVEPASKGNVHSDWLGGIPYGGDGQTSVKELLKRVDRTAQETVATGTAR